jgi:hypothetical protein
MSVKNNPLKSLYLSIIFPILHKIPIFSYVIAIIYVLTIIKPISLDLSTIRGNSVEKCSTLVLYIDKYILKV